MIDIVDYRDISVSVQVTGDDGGGADLELTCGDGCGTRIRLSADDAGELARLLTDWLPDDVDDVDPAAEERDRWRDAFADQGIDSVGTSEDAASLIGDIADAFRKLRNTLGDPP